MATFEALVESAFFDRMFVLFIKVIIITYTNSIKVIAPTFKAVTRFQSRQLFFTFSLLFLDSLCCCLLQEMETKVL